MTMVKNLIAIVLVILSVWLLAGTVGSSSGYTIAIANQPLLAVVLLILVLAGTAFWIFKYQK